MMKTELRDITPEIAGQMLKRNHRNRKPSKGNVKFLTREMNNGNWVFDGSPIRLTEDGRLLDGQHRLTAIVESGTTQQFLIVSGIKAETFKVMDTGKGRNSSDVFSIEGISNATIASATSRIVMRHSKGISYEEGIGFKPSNTDLLTFYNDNSKIEEFVAKSDLLYREFNKVIPASTIAGFGYLMAEKSITHSEEFWNKVCTGLALEKGSPMKVLRDKLIADKFSKSSLPYQQKTALIFKAWNHFRKGKKIKYLKWNKENEKFPVLI